MKAPEDKPENVDLNLDAEQISEASAAEGMRLIEEAAAATGLAPEPGAETEELVAPDEVKALVGQLAKLQAEKDDLYQTLVRRQADFENFRKRTERERQEDGKRFIAMFIEGMLPVLDAFERALAAPVEAGFESHRVGFELIYKQVWESLSKQGLERIESRGKAFDPFVHQAIERVESAEHEDGTVLEELQRGYRMKDRVLRPAMVRVSSRPAGAEAAAAAGEDSPVN
jgi:molecular chaperone GrpE